MSDVNSWYPLAASNNASPPNGFPEGMLPDMVNNASREVMAAVARQRLLRKFSRFDKTAEVGSENFGSTYYISGRRAIYYDAIYNKYILVGSKVSSGKGAILVSLYPWAIRTMTEKTSGTTPLYAVYGNGAGTLWVAVGSGGAIYTSTDLSTWTSRTSGTVQDLNDVYYANSLWVAVGNNGTILTSPDAITWTSRTSALSGNLYGIAYGASVWVVVGVFGTTGVAQSSPDATTWTERSTGNITGGCYGVGFGNSKFVISGSTGTDYYVYTSTNGTAWSSVAGPLDATSTYPLIGSSCRPVYEQGMWVIPYFGQLLYSYDNAVTFGFLSCINVSSPLLSTHMAVYSAGASHPAIFNDNTCLYFSGDAL